MTISILRSKELIIIAGPTAVGKTELAGRLASELKTEIISADSRQIYREMKIGTAVPDESLLRAVKHHFIRVKSIHDYYNASKYEFEVLDLLDSLFEKYNRAVMVGGSGLYINAVKFGIDELPPMDPDLRMKIKYRIENEGIESLRKELRILDPETYLKIDLKNPKRIQKALEICLITGKPYSTFLKNKKKNRNFHIKTIILNTEREKLYQRINQRVLKMMENGLEEEAKSLYRYKDVNALNTVGYKELFNYFDEILPLGEAIHQIQANSRKYARKQITWFRRYNDAVWFEPDDFDKIISYIRNK